MNCTNETLCRWTFKFHKVVRQQNSGAVEDFILPYSAVYLGVKRWKHYWNQSTFAKVIVKIKEARFFYGPRCIFSTLLYFTLVWRVIVVDAAYAERLMGLDSSNDNYRAYDVSISTNDDVLTYLHVTLIDTHCSLGTIHWVNSRINQKPKWNSIHGSRWNEIDMDRDWQTDRHTGKLAERQQFFFNTT